MLPERALFQGRRVVEPNLSQPKFIFSLWFFCVVFARFIGEHLNMNSLKILRNASQESREVPIRKASGLQIVAYFPSVTGCFGV